MSRWGALYTVWGRASTRCSTVRASRSPNYIPNYPSRSSASMRRTAFAACYTRRELTRSPVEEKLYLDADTVVLGTLNYGFEKARKFGLARCICAR